MSDFADLGFAFNGSGALAAERAFANVERGADKVERATRGAEKATQGLAASMAQSGNATGLLEGRLKTAQAAGLNATRQFTDLGVSLASGAPPMLVMIQQLPQLADGFAVAKAQGVGATEVLKSMLGFVSPLTVGLGLVAGAATALGLGWMRGRDSAHDYQQAVTGVGRAAGLTADDLRGLTVAAAEQGNVSIAAAREQAAAYLQTGQVASEVLTRLIVIGKDYAAVMGVDAKEATKQLAAAMGDPEKASIALTRSMGLLTQAQIRQIEKMQEAGDLMGAQTVLLAGLENAMKGQAGQVDEVTTAWDALGRSISNAIERFGEFMYVTKDERLTRLNAGIAAAQRQIEAGGRLRPGYLEDLIRQRDALEAVGIAERNTGRIRAAEAAANQRAQRAWEASEESRREQQRATEQLAREAEAARRRAAEEEERRYQSLIQGGERYRDGLTYQARTYGMLQIDVIRFNAAMEAQKLVTEGNTAEAVKLAHSILDAADAYTKLIVEMDKVQPPGTRTLTQDAPSTVLRDLRTADLDRTITGLREIEELGYRAGFGMQEAFGSAGQALADLNDTMARFPRAYLEITRAQIAGEISVGDANRKRATLTIEGYGDMASAAKGFFAEGSRGYKAMQAVEQVYRAWQMASSIQATAQGWIEASQSVAQATVKASADTAAGGARMFSQLGAFAFPAVAAMVAVMAGLGMGSGGGASTYKPPVTNLGAGTVLGNPTAESESLTKSLELAERYWNRDLQYSNEMVTALRAIRDGIGGLVDRIAQQMGVGGAFDTSGLNLGTSTSRSLFGLLSTQRSSQLVGQGVQLNSGSLGSILSGGLSGLIYQLIENTKTKSGFLGLGGGTTTWTTEITKPLEAGLAQDLTRLLATLRDGVLTAAGQLGIEGAAATLDALQISLGRIDFSGMSSDEISKRLTAVFSAVGDQMATALLPGLSAYQRAGEGMLETLSRLATTFRAVDTTLASIGMNFGAVGLASLEARNRLVDLSGGLEAFTDQAGFFAENFLTEAQRIAPVQAAVTAELARLGLAGNLTRDQFAATVLGLDLTTEAGASMYAALMRLAPAFDAVSRFAEDAATEAARAAAALLNQRRGLEIALLDATGQTTAALAARRQDELAAMDASLHALQLQVWAAQDARTAQDALARAQEEAARSAAQYQQTLMQGVEEARNRLSQAYQREAQDLQNTIDRFAGFADSLKSFRDSLGQQMPGATSYDATRAAFLAMAGRASAGDATAMGGLQASAQAYLDAARLNAGSGTAYALDVARVRRSLADAIGGADAQKTIAERQLDQLKSLVSPLVDINESVLSVRDAILALNTARQVAGLPAFANGGVFSNSMVSSPSLFNLGLMGEAGPEAIVPLHMGPDGLGVRMTGANDNEALLARVDALTAEIRALREENGAENRAIVSATHKTARGIDRIEGFGLYVRGERVGDPVETKDVA